MMKYRAHIAYIPLALCFISCLELHAMDEPSQEFKKVRLKSYKYKAASVLPVMYQPEDEGIVKYALLGQETHPRKCGEYDDFGGSRNKAEKHPKKTAAREFYEEAILGDTLEWTLAETQEKIDLKNGNTERIIGYNKRVTYITVFTPEEIALIKSYFHDARSKQSNLDFKEKQQLATVRWDCLEDAIKNAQANKKVTVPAMLVNASTGTDEDCETDITLRSNFVNKLKPFLLKQEYKEGKKENIQLYEKNSPE